MTQTSLPRKFHIKGTDPEGGGKEGDGALLLPLLPPKDVGGKGEISNGCREQLSGKRLHSQHLALSGHFFLGCCTVYTCDMLIAGLASVPRTGMPASSEGRSSA